jgi:hypothetical protein
MKIKRRIFPEKIYSVPMTESKYRLYSLYQRQRSYGVIGFGLKTGGQVLWNNKGAIAGNLITGKVNSYIQDQQSQAEAAKQANPMLARVTGQFGQV